MNTWGIFAGLTAVAMVLPCGARGQVPSITSVSNAALPQLDAHLPGYFKPGSLATVFGNGLAVSAMAGQSPWPPSLGGTELHLVVVGAGCGSVALPCELVAPLLYAGPTQINFLIPNVSAASYGQSALLLDIIVVENGARFDTKSTFYLSPGGDFAEFQVGFDCQFSLSISQPQACGYSQSSGQYRLPLGAMTDASGGLISSRNPVRQGQPVTLWATGIGLLSVDPKTGLSQQNSPSKISFGSIQLDSTQWAQIPTWAGESPQFQGLDQINVTFPACQAPAAAVEKRYDAYLVFNSPIANRNLGLGFATLYLPMLIAVGEPRLPMNCDRDARARVGHSALAYGQ